MSEKREVEQQHCWVAYGQAFSGYGSSMDPHHCGDPDEPCFTRERVVVTTEGEWSKWTAYTAPTDKEQV